MSENIYSVKPREVELARQLKDHEFEWDIMTGDWFFADDKLHVVMRKESSGNSVNVYGLRDHQYDLDDVVFLPHPSQCKEWINSNGWDLKMEDMSGEGVKITIRKRHTEFKIEKTEPTEMAALYAVMLGAMDLDLFGW
ncbi:MAG: hypothetical protein ACLFUS_10755 [Candidatus Sumerlaeia bacterium]